MLLCIDTGQFKEKSNIPRTLSRPFLRSSWSPFPVNYPPVGLPVLTDKKTDLYEAPIEHLESQVVTLM
ncbi:hypothetical protein Y1Q_0007770 [Alligator mississippiensis]|uniref:Uncharacterized protein n=1 Tax=Alligator mississippiensis TaxID=8496 RepID=A0A151N6X8_ALLMI|nr:hypothetical protein Y1Q_0007770 [Alligator mississippiensis]